MRMLLVIMALTLSSCEKESLYALTLKTKSNHIAMIRIETSSHALSLDSLSRGTSATFDGLYGKRPDTLEVSWVNALGKPMACLLSVNAIYPDDFDFQRDGYVISLEDNGASLTFLIRENEHSSREVGRLACCPL